MFSLDFVSFEDIVVVGSAHEFPLSILLLKGQIDPFELFPLLLNNKIRSDVCMCKSILQYSQNVDVLRILMPIRSILFD